MGFTLHHINTGEIISEKDYHILPKEKRMCYVITYNTVTHEVINNTDGSFNVIKIKK